MHHDWQSLGAANASGCNIAHKVVHDLSVHTLYATHTCAPTRHVLHHIWCAGCLILHLRPSEAALTASKNQTAGQARSLAEREAGREQCRRCCHACSTSRAGTAGRAAHRFRTACATLFVFAAGACAWCRCKVRAAPCFVTGPRCQIMPLGAASSHIHVRVGRITPYICSCSQSCCYASLKHMSCPA